jgi:hypothetical protein
MKTEIDAVNEFKGVWPFKNRVVMVFCVKSYAMHIQGVYSSFIHEDYSLLSDNFQPVCARDEFNQCVEDMKTNWGASVSVDEYNEQLKVKSVFTQEMCDNDVLPSVGMEFMWTQWAPEELKLAKMLAISGGECWIEIGDNSIIVGNITGCKPLTPPITLIDGKAYQFDIKKECGNAVDIQGIYSESLLVFQSVGNAFFRSTVTNIQPLTVEVK